VFSTHSPHASLFLIYVRFGPGVDGIGSVLVERGTPGFAIGEPSAFMSGEEWCQLYFENCRIPAGNVAREHVLIRKQFGRPLCEFQGIQWKFAEMALKLEAAQLLLYKAVMEGEHGLPSAHTTAMAKLACNQAGWDVANEALQAMGAMGYSRESLVEYCVRRTRGWMIAGGSIEMLKNRIAEGVFGRSFSQRPPKTA
jgi:alkylation response protein AidB-like acyl-CoA dehydrogenase